MKQNHMTKMRSGQSHHNLQGGGCHTGGGGSWGPHSSHILNVCVRLDVS